MGRDRRSWGPGGPGFAARAASSLAAGNGKPVAGGAGDCSERRRTGAPARTRAAAPAWRWQRWKEAARRWGAVVSGRTVGTGHPSSRQTWPCEEEESPGAAPQCPGTLGPRGHCPGRRFHRKPSSGQGSPGGDEGAAGRGCGGRRAPAAQYLLCTDWGLGPQPSHGALVGAQQQREYPLGGRWMSLSPDSKGEWGAGRRDR